MKNSFPSKPLYHKLGVKKIFQRYEKALKIWEKCALCPRSCGANRFEGKKGECGADHRLVIANYGPHFGEESVLVGNKGSGTIFFVYCNLYCVFCQNWTISRGKEKGETISSEKLAHIMLTLQTMGCHNINLVTPTPHIPPILSAIGQAAKEGLEIPIVYNCGGYEQPNVIKLLEGIIDIYMPDCKYGSSEIAFEYSGVPDYTESMKLSLKEMQRQVGDLQTDKRGIAYRGLLTRHLVLPEELAGTAEVIRFLANEISPQCAINVMEQYYPSFLAEIYPQISRRVSRKEFLDAKKMAQKAGLQIIN